jgi:DNA-binding MarR family transcriptional regulator
MAIEGELESDVDVDVEAAVDADLLELLQIMPAVIRAMKRQRPEEEGEPPAAVQALLSAGALGPRHLPVIVALSLQGTMAVSELARRIGLGVAATSLMVGELAKAGVVERHVDEHDRRRTIVSISEGLRDDCERLARERLSPLRKALEAMGPQTRSHFLVGWRVLAAQTVGEEDLEAGDTAACEPSR